MFHLIPSNKQENLVAMLNALLRSERAQSGMHPFEPDTIVVESMGMKHYLSMELARLTGITINIEFPLLVRSVYQLCRALLGEDSVPRESPYKREILVWRIYELLGSEAFLQRSDCHQAHAYWQGSTDTAANPSFLDLSQSLRMRYLLAKETADVFEQYSQFRPQWIQAWEQGAGDEAWGEHFEGLAQAKHLIHWQGVLWQMLVSQTLVSSFDTTQTTNNGIEALVGPHPVQILTRALDILMQPKLDASIRQRLPKSLHIFAVNAISEQHLAFFNALSQHIDIYFFYLNPCMEFWGDLLSDKARARAAIAQSQSHLLDEDSPNPLLANLGQQGRALFNQFQHYDFVDITESALFSDGLLGSDTSPGLNQTQAQRYDLSNEGEPSNEGKPSLLAAIQSSLLRLSSANSDDTKVEIREADCSVSINSCHSTVREIQVLHDALLRIMQEDLSIEPHDVIVMCPAIEDYAPYVSSVFDVGRGKDYSPSAEPRLVCSVADRAPLDADPMVAMFMDMLSLPDSRFSAPQLLDYLALPSIQSAFELQVDELEHIENWVKQANIYWALDAEHKQSILSQQKPEQNLELNRSPEHAEHVSEDDEIYTWQWGIARIMKGSLSAHSDIEQSNLLPLVQGLKWQGFGKLQAFISRLANIRRALSKARTMPSWRSYLVDDVLHHLFGEHDRKEGAYLAIKRGIDSLLANMDKAGLSSTLPLAVVQQELSDYFSTPDALNRYNTGQVTFSSMVPMRSVPFKVVCMLGLNDGVFPRRTEFSSVNIMGFDTPKRGDRSRKNEDRYLFLEAIMSARDYLYLSYQGQDQYNNKTRAPSLVLTELRDFISARFSLGASKVDSAHPLQPFNLNLFQQGQAQSYAKQWLALQERQLQGLEHAQAYAANAWPLAIHVSYDHLGSMTVGADGHAWYKYSEKTIESLFKSPLAYLIKTRFAFDVVQYFDAKKSNEPFALPRLNAFKLEQACIEKALSFALTQDTSSGNESDALEFSLKPTLEHFISRGDIPKQALQSDDLQAYQKPFSFEANSVDAASLNIRYYRYQANMDTVKEYLRSSFLGAGVQGGDHDNAPANPRLFEGLENTIEQIQSLPEIELDVPEDEQLYARYIYSREISAQSLLSLIFAHCVRLLASKSGEHTPSYGYYYRIDLKDKGEFTPLRCDEICIGADAISEDAAHEFVHLIMAVDFISLHSPCVPDAAFLIEIRRDRKGALGIQRANQDSVLDDFDTLLESISKKVKSASNHAKSQSVSFLFGTNSHSLNASLPPQPLSLLQRILESEALKAVVPDQKQAEKKGAKD